MLYANFCYIIIENFPQKFSPCTKYFLNLAVGWECNDLPSLTSEVMSIYFEFSRTNLKMTKYKDDTGSCRRLKFIVKGVYYVQVVPRGTRFARIRSETFGHKT